MPTLSRPTSFGEAALAREADEHRPAERAELVEAADELEVVLGGLAEADARVEADPALVDSRRDGEREPLLEEPLHVGDDVVVHRIRLHRPRLALHVHQADVAASVRDDARELGVGAQRGDVVDELDAELDRAARHRRLRRVDRDGRAGEVGEHRLDALELLGRRDAGGARTGRLAADVDDRRAGLEHPPGGRHRGVGPQVDTAVRERVRRDVQHAHHGRRREAFLDRWL